MFNERPLRARSRILAWVLAGTVLSLGFAVGSLAGCQDDTDDSCHYDCFGAVECHDGTVISKDHTILSCSSDGICPYSTVGTCQKGCAVKDLEYHGCPMRICRENYPKRPGDSCTTEADCHPSMAVRADGGIGQTHLRCDVALGICVETDGPELSDWLGPCDPVLMAHVQKGAYGTLADTTCSAGWCAYFADHEENCVRQGCTRACANDQECPPGSVCQTTADCRMAEPGYGYCKPGSRDAFGVGLSCR